MKTDASDALAALTAVLEAERRALLAGDLAALTGFVAQKTALLETLQEARSDNRGDVAALRSAVEQNLKLIEEAKAGVSSVVSRVKELSRVRTGLDTYNSAGGRERHPSGASRTLARRA